MGGRAARNGTREGSALIGGHLNQRPGDRAFGTADFVKNGKVIMRGQDAQRDRQPACTRGVGVVGRLALQLRELFTAHEQAQRGQAGGQLAQRT